MQLIFTEEFKEILRKDLDDAEIEVWEKNFQDLQELKEIFSNMSCSPDELIDKPMDF
jgi:hypothetical protein